MRKRKPWRGMQMEFLHEKKGQRCDGDLGCQACAEVWPCAGG